MSCITSIILIISIFNIAAGTRVSLAQNAACYYQPYHKHLACQCVQSVVKAYLPLHMEYWVKKMNQEVIQKNNRIILFLKFLSG